MPETTIESDEDPRSVQTPEPEVTDINEAAVSAISDSNGAANAVNENVAVGTNVGITAFASDSDGTDSVSYSLSNDAGGLFAIDATTGVVTVAGALDRESAASHTIEVTATSSDGSTSTQSFTIALNDVDEFDVSPVIDTDAGANTLAETAGAGTAVGVVASASDADATTNAISYSVDDTRFSVDPDGTVRVAAGASFDFETEQSIDIVVTATSADGSSSNQSFTLAVTDINEAAVSAISDSNGAANAVNENVAVGTNVGITAFASDSDGTDSVSYSLSNDAGGLFAIDATTGVVTVAGALDRESAASHTIEVTATSSDGSTSTQSYTIALNDVDEFDVSPVIDTDAGANTLAETAGAGTAVGVVASASDADATTNAISYSVDDTRFSVDPDGTVRVAAGASFDFETEQSIDIVVTATSADGSSSNQSFTLAVTDINEAAVSAISDSNGAANAVNENAAIGTNVGITAFASDSDGTDSVSYSLSNDAGGLFAIDATTGVVTVAGALDRESAASHTIEVTATSSDGSTSTQSYTIALNDVDEFDVSPVIDTDAGANTLAETAGAGTAVGVVASASDADATTNAISYSVDDTRFSVDPDGTVRVAAGASFDFETEQSIDIVVTATSADGSSSNQSFTLAVTDINEAAVSAISDSNGAANAVNENVAVGTNVGITAFASDSDGTDSVSYSLSDDAGGLFAIDATTGVVTVAGALDRESAASHTIEVTATSSDGSTSTQRFTIALNDVDEFDVSPVIDTDAGANTLAETAGAGTAVGVVASASDADATTNAISYSVDDTRFSVDPDGTVRVAAGASFDFETEQSIDIVVTATSADGSSSNQTFTLAVTDINEAAVSAISDSNGAANAVNENVAVGTNVGITAFASDSDGTDSVSYSLSNDAGGLFAIDATTGVVTVAGALDRESAASHTIEVTATSSDGSTSTQSYTIALNDVDEFDVSPVIDTDAGANTLAETAGAGTAVGVVASASDADATTNAISYSVDDTRFSVDPDGTVRVAAGASFDFETEQSIDIVVTATSADGSSSNQTFTLAVTDINEAAVSAISDSNGAANAVNENVAVGTNVGITAFASDSDGTDSVSYSLSNDAGGLFAIDATTGVVTVAGALDRESAASHTIEVTATSSDGSTSTQSYTIALNDVDEFDVSPVIDTDAGANTLAETAGAGTAVGVVASASDADATTNAISYSVDDTRFSVDPDGTVRVAAGASFDFETEQSIDIVVTATSADGSSSNQSFTLAVTDINEAAVSAISDSNGAANAVNENVAVGTNVGITAFASDSDGTDSVSYSLSNDAGGLFAIDATTGVVTVAGALDRESAASHTIEVTATSSDGSTSTQSYTIALNDVDEFDVSPVIDTDAGANTLAETAGAGTAVGVVASASDADATTNAISYSVDDTRFSVDPDGTVRVAAGASFDFETEQSIDIVVTATSADGSSSNQSFTLAVTDINEAAVSAISDSNGAANAVNENAAIGTNVGITAFASDSDGTDSVSYSLSNDAGGLFAIDATTGVVTVAGALDRESAASHTIEVTATSSDGSTSTQSYTIALNDVDEFDVSPVIDTDAGANTLAETAGAGTAVGVVASASDADATTNAISYSVDDTRFSVDPDGTVRVAAGASFDFETEQSIDIVVTATSADGSSSNQSFTLAVTDINEAAVSAISDSNGAANAVNENAAIGTNVGITAFASDSDGTDSVSYSLSNDAGGLFAIDATTGVVTVAGALDRESAASHTIEVTATSSDGSTSTQSFTIALNDVDEFDVSPVIDTDAGANTLAETAGAGTAVGVVASASDADATTNAISYSVDDTRFSVDPDGTVRVAAGASFDFETEQSIDIVVTATSADGSTSNQTFTIDVTNVVDEAPTDITFTGGTVNETVASGGSIDSSYNPSGATVAVLSTTDADGGIDSFTYAITNDPSGHFEIVGNEVRVRSGQNIDYETATSHDVTIQVTDANGATYLETITINVADYEGSYTTSDAGQNITGTSEEDVLTGGAGNDTISGGAGADQIFAGGGDDYLYVDADDTLIHGGAGADTVIVDTAAGVTLDMPAAEIEHAVGNAGNDQFDATGSTVRVTLRGNGGDDVLTGGEGNDEINGGAGADQLFGGGGNDVFYIDADDTLIRGGAGADTVIVDTAAGVTLDMTTSEIENAVGNAGNDQFDATGSTVRVTLRGNGGDDVLTGGEGNDEINGGAGADQFFGGGGDDFMYIDADDTLIRGGAGADTVIVDTAAGVTLDMTTAEIENAVGNAGNDQFDASGSTVRVTLRGNGGDDVLTGGEGNDEINGGAGADQLFGGGGDDFFYIDADDTLIRGGAGEDTVLVDTAAGVTLDMTTAEIENAVGNAGNDHFDATGSTVRVTLRGNGGNDSLTGGDGNDLVEGGDGADQLTGGGGNDTIDGGADIDTAIFSGNRSDYTIVVEGSGYRITDTRSGSPDGSDLVLNVENFQFADMTVAEADLLNSAPTDLALTSSGVAEDATAGQVVGTLSATDADSGEIFAYALVDGTGNPLTDSNFEIVGNEIRVKTGSSLDAETSTSHDLIVQVTDSAGFTFQKPVTVTVNDVDEFDVSPVSDSNGAANSVDETAAIGATVGITAFASDGDATTNGVTYSLTDDAGGLFAIDSSTGVVTVAGALDFESQTSHAITVRATSADGSISTQSFNIGINDINDETPTNISFASSGINEEGTGKITFTLAGEKDLDPPLIEVFANGVSLGIVELTDAHDTRAHGNASESDLEAIAQTFTLDLPVGVTDPGTISFTMLNDSYDPVNGYDTNFYIREVSVGETTVPGYQATGAGGTYGEWASVYGNNAPRSFLPPSGGWDIRQIAGTLSTTDADASNSFTYTLTSDPSGLFEISGDEIIVRPGMETNFEAATSHTVTVEVNDGAGNTYSQAVTINVNDVNEAPTDIAFSGATVSAVSNTIAAGTIVANIDSVADPDAGDSFTYALTDDAGGAFTINSATGAVSLVANTDISQVVSDTVTVQVTDSGGNTYNETIGIQLGTTENDSITGTSNDDIIYGLGSFSTSGSNLIVNGSFEADIISGEVQNFSSITGWSTTTGDIEIKRDGHAGINASDGNQWLEMDAQSAVDMVYQDVQTQAGTDYILSLDVARRSGHSAETNTIHVYWAGQLIETIVPTNTSWETLTFTVTGTGGLDRLEFREDATNNNLYGGFFDNVTMLEIADDPDTLNGGAGNDTIHGGAQGDLLIGGAGDDRLYGGAGNDTLRLESGADVLDGGDGHDVLDIWSSGGVTVNLATGTVSGTGVNGTTVSGIEEVWGGDGNDILTGSSAAETLYGDNGNDTISGGAGDDNLYGEVGEDQLSGGTGDDLLSGGAGDDTMFGEDGNDIFIYAAGDGRDDVSGGSGGGWTDAITLQGMDGAISIDGREVTGQGWEMDLDSGSSVVSQNGESLTLSNDASGRIEFADGDRIDFAGIERITW
ncbi:cadherin domain-containing protein [Hoeflea phototrophica]|uniref:cadherin domain-containing protein n=1 Tax=Hoeflea phototrophica TaxID=244596 RepID=UPI00058B3BB0|nr:cadherin domain-containing protein [Hoeflea phototrophica]